jgi:large subunit ribosomal protein L21
MPFAIVAIAGVQEKASPGARLRVPRLKGGKEGDSVTFDQVLLLRRDGEDAQVGTPFVKGARIEAKILGNGRGEKIRVFTMKHRKRHRRTQGHRQGFTDIEVTGIAG